MVARPRYMEGDISSIPFFFRLAIICWTKQKPNQRDREVQSGGSLESGMTVDGLNMVFDPKNPLSDRPVPTCEITRQIKKRIAGSSMARPSNP